MYRPSQTPRLTLSSERIVRAERPVPREGPVPPGDAALNSRIEGRKPRSPLY